MRLSEAIKKYLDSITGKKSARTVYTYKKSLNKFLNFVGDVEVIGITDDLVSTKFKNYLIEETHLNEVSAIYVLQHARYFFEYLQAENIKSLDPKKLIDLVY